ncbi:MAG: hypothetical protein QXP38_07240 [Nitrososphaerota archaeon]
MNIKDKYPFRFYNHSDHMAEKTERDIVRIGLTLPVKLLQKTKYLHLVSSMILFPYEISFSDFINLVLKASTYGVFPVRYGTTSETPVEDDGDTVFYPIRIPSELKDETIESLKVGESKIWKEIPPIDYNRYVKNQLLKVNTSEGTYTMLFYVWYLKVIFELLKKSGIDSETVLKRGYLPDIPQLYGPLNEVLEEYIKNEIDALTNKPFLFGKKNKSDLRESLLLKLKDVIEKLREDSKVDYDIEEIAKIVVDSVDVLSTFSIWIDFSDKLDLVSHAIIHPKKEIREHWIKLQILIYKLVLETLKLLSLTLSLRKVQ